MPTYNEVPADLKDEAKERADSARGSFAWIFAKALINEPLDKLAEKRFLADEIVGTIEREGRLFFFFTDFTSLVFDKVENKNVIIDTQSCCFSIAESYIDDQGHSKILVASTGMDS
jgi:hypothetical protein